MLSYPRPLRPSHAFDWRRGGGEGCGEKESRRDDLIHLFRWSADNDAEMYSRFCFLKYIGLGVEEGWEGGRGGYKGLLLRVFFLRSSRR